MAFYRAVAKAPAATPERVGVLVVNLGSPDSPSYFSVQNYLRQFLSDRRVIDTSRFVWLPVLFGFILPFRPIRTVRNYRKIWVQGGSPLVVYSRRLAKRIEESLRAGGDDRLRVAIAMTYGRPSVAAAIRELAAQNCRRLLVLPLYPQYCSSTTGSVFDAVTRVLRRWRWLPETRFVNDYHDDPGYIDAVAERIERHWREQGERTHLLLSYHGIPEVYVTEGDPYQAHAEKTTRLIVARLGLAEGEWSHCYQSRFGPVKWLQPYASDMLKALAERGVRKLTMVSPSFAVDCLETIEECGIEYRDEFRELGGESFSLVPALNDEPRHGELLAAVVRRHLAGWI